jgi:hypothetical protein
MKHVIFWEVTPGLVKIDVSEEHGTSTFISQRFSTLADFLHLRIFLP